MLDLVLRGGRIADGSGSALRRADVGIRAGRVAAIGAIHERAERTIDVGGQVVAPGFIDVHTHYDAQAFWDPTLSPSPLHGVTTVLAGNCGFTIAPLDRSSADYLMRTLARVEGMPLESLEAGVPWDWQTTGEFLDRLDGRLGVNAGFSVGHTAIRRVVMGESASHRTSTDSELAAMVALLRDGLDAGALGFSSSWGGVHNDAHGEPVPSRHADADELVALAGVCRHYPGTSLEFIPPAGAFTPDHLDVMTRMSAAAQRPLNWNVMVVDAANVGTCLQMLEAGTHARANGGKVVALTMPMTPVLRFTFRTGFLLDTLPGWAHPMALPASEKLALLRDPRERRRLGALASQPGPRHHHAQWGSMVIEETFAPELRHYQGQRVADIAINEGKYPFDALLDIVCADDLRTTFVPVAKEDTAADWAARLQVWRDGRAVIGASDAGAHLDFLSTFNYTTWLLQRAVREEGVIPLEEAVHLLTDVPARLYGLQDRGLLQEGGCADIVVFDPATVGSEPVRTRFDLPGGAGRLYAGATGISRVLVNGVELVIDGTFTEHRPGTLLRAGRDTRTPALD